MPATSLLKRTGIVERQKPRDWHELLALKMFSSPKRPFLRAKALAANVMGIRSFAALKRTSGAFARQQSHGAFRA